MKNTIRSSRGGLRLSVMLLCALLLSACGGGGSGDSGGIPTPSAQTETGTVSGRVVVAMSNERVPNATVSVGSATATTAADGSYTLSAGVGERVTLRINAANFAETFQIVRVTARQTTAVDVQLLRVGAPILVNVAAGGSVTVPDSSAQVTFPANALVPKTGGTASATVNVVLTPINPADDASLMPGDYTAVTAAGGPPVSIESFGALLVEIRDTIGTRYTLAAGESATIRIPLGTRSASPPGTISLFYFNESTGRWIEEGSATLTDTTPNPYYEGSVTHFSFWKAGKVMDTAFISGCVNDAADKPVAHARVRSNGTDYSGAASAYTAADGTFRVAVRLKGLATLSDIAPNGTPLSNTVNVGPLSADFTLPDCLKSTFNITTSSLPAGTVDAAYTATLAATNGTPPYSAWSMSVGTLPQGLTLIPATGQISGTPTLAGTTTFTVLAQDSATPPRSAIRQFTIVTSAAFSGLELARASGCLNCHSVDATIFGPAFMDVSNRYKGNAGAKVALIAKVKTGGSGNWGSNQMPANSPRVSDENIGKLVDFILGLSE